MKFRTIFFVVALALLIPIQFASGLEIYKSRGTVVKMNLKTRSLTLKMEAVPKLKWPPMTMDFEVWDGRKMENLKPGQQVEFEFVVMSKTHYLISKLSPSK